MKKILKTCIVGISTLPVVSLSTFSFSCSKDKNDALIADFKQQIIDQFIELSKTYRATFYTKAVCDYIWEWAIKNEFVTLACPLGYSESPTTEQFVNDDNGYNIEVIVPASEDGKDLPTVALQAHTDMVAKGEISYQTGVDVEIEGDIMHSKNYQSSLGADNGVGVATMMVLANNSDKFTHGVLKLFFTTDEEDGPSGASYVPAEWLLYDPAKEMESVKYLINLDSESSTDAGIGCAGCYQAALPRMHVTEPFKANEKQYTIVISGLQGGHSGTTINLHRINAIKLMAYLFGELNKASTDDDSIRFISAYEGESPLDDSSIGNIPEKMTFSISTSLSKEVIDQKIQLIKERALKDHPTETELTIDISDYDGIYTDALTSNDSYKLTEFVRLIPYGPVTFWQWGIKTSSNVNTFRIRDKYFTKPEYNVYVEAMGRSHSKVELEQLKLHYKEMKDQAFGVSDPTNIVDKADLSAWDADETDPLIQTVIQAAKEKGQELNFVKQHWWLEIATFYEKTPGINMVSIGMTIKNPHTKQEIIELKTIDPFLKLLLTTLRNLK